MFRKFPILLISLFVVSIAFADQHAPAISVTKQVTIDAPASEVWAQVKDFDGAGWLASGGRHHRAPRGRE